MPSHYHIRTRTLFVLASLLALSGVAYAANVSTQSRPNYQRLMFDFAGPARMEVAQGNGTVTLTFSKPITGSIDAIAPKLQPYVTASSLSANKKSITLTLDKPYRVRQFISGNMVGIDILTERPLNPTPAKPAPAPEPTPAPKPAAPKAAPAPIAAPEPLAPAPQPEPKPEPKPQPVKAPEPVTPEPAAPEPEPEVSAIRDTPSPILSTKPVETEAPTAEPKPSAGLSPEMAEKAATTAPLVRPLLTTKTPEPVVEAPAAPEPEAAPEPAPEVEAAPVEIEAEAAAAETAMPVADPDKPFLVSAKKTAAGTDINFPWGERTAAAVFERDHDIWVVFSREKPVDTALLASVLPKQVTALQQFKLAGATVLRLSTDGTLHPTTTQAEGTYEWNLSLSPVQPSASLDIPVAAQTVEGNRQLMLKVFDVSPPLTFYDPALGDRLIVVPTFELNRGVATLKHFPELDILPTQQGIAVVSRRDDLRASQGRAGVKLLADASLAISASLPIYSADNRPVPGASAAADVLMPYDQWYVAPADFAREREARLNAVVSGKPAQAAGNLMRMVELYMGQGMAAEALGYLDLLKRDHPEYVAENKLNVIGAASLVMLDRVPEATKTLAAPELEGVAEAAMWRELVKIFVNTSVSEVEQMQADTEAETAARMQAAADAAVESGDDIPVEPVAMPAPPPAPLTFDFLSYNTPYIRFYPPRMRQHLAVVSADAYLRNNQPEEALKVYDTLNRDGILGPVQGLAEFTLGSVAAKKGKNDEALKLFDRLGTRYDDPLTQVRAKYAAIMLRHTNGLETPENTTNALEALRLSWRGDTLQRDMLHTLAQIYNDTKRYDDTLRTWKYLIEMFPGDTDMLAISGDMAQLFEELFLGGLADEMPPLKSLALFYEFRELTPIGTKGNQIIQKLADRLASVDLIDRAAQLLENQVKFRLSGEDRARVGARLSLLYLLNKQPQQALDVLEVTNYGEAPLELRRHRIQLTAQALSDLGKHEEALSMLFHDDTPKADLLRLDILWAMKDWPNVINTSEDILTDRANLTSALTPHETEVLIKLALGYSFEGDTTQLRYLRDYYTGLLPESQYKEVFNFLTNDTTPLDPEDFQLVAQQISRTEGFLDTFRKDVAEGKLSEAVK